MPQISHSQSSKQMAIHPEFPAQDPDLVRQTVGSSHWNLEKVKELVGRSPALANAAWDWGFGDWETAIGAASHTGQAEIAEFLMANGARPDIFTFAMLGHLDALKAAIKAQPGIQRTPGPHGISLLDHAKNSERGEKVAEYLESLGDADPNPVSLSTTDSEKQAFLGSYRFGETEKDVISITLSKEGTLQFECRGRLCRLHRVEANAYAPAGSPHVRLRFAVVEGKAVSLTAHDPEPLVIAKRI